MVGTITLESKFPYSTFSWFVSFSLSLFKMIHPWITTRYHGCFRGLFLSLHSSFHANTRLQQLCIKVIVSFIFYPFSIVAFLSLKLAIHRLVLLTYQILASKPQTYKISICVLEQEPLFVPFLLVDTGHK